MGSLIERLSYLERKYSKVSVLQSDFNMLKMWIECQFGLTFPKGQNDGKHEWENDNDNPFYEIEVLRQRIALMEAKVLKLENHTKQPPRPATFTSAVAAAMSSKPATGKKYVSAKSMVRPKGQVGKIISQSKSVSKEKDTSAPPSKIALPVKANVAASATVQEESSNPVKCTKVEKDKTVISIMGTQEIKKEAEDNYMDVDKSTTELNSSEVVATPVSKTSPQPVTETTDDKMEEGENTAHSSSSALQQSNSATSVNQIPTSSSLSETEKQAVTYTTRGRRHILPRRYAEFTPHTNVPAILKKQRPISSPPKKVIKVPEKLKPTGTATYADEGQSATLQTLAAKVQARKVDSKGQVILSDAFPNVKVNQEHLLSIIYRTGGKSTRLTRKLTTLIFEDALLASASPFGTKYYKDRLPPEPLEAIVDFIMTSGFEPTYTQKKIYMIVGQVCNEARAGRVKKLPAKLEILD